MTFYFLLNFLFCSEIQAATVGCFLFHEGVGWVIIGDSMICVVRIADTIASTSQSVKINTQTKKSMRHGYKIINYIFICNCLKISIFLCTMEILALPF